MVGSAASAGTLVNLDATPCPVKSHDVANSAREPAHDEADRADDSLVRIDTFWPGDRSHLADSAGTIERANEDEVLVSVNRRVEQQATVGGPADGIAKSPNLEDLIRGK
jgi:hypothetical protein